MIPVAVDGALKELHWILRLLELAVGRADLSTHAADAGVALKRVGPPLRFLVHHLQHVATTLLGCGQLLDRDGQAEIRSGQTLNTFPQNKIVCCAVPASCAAQDYRYYNHYRFNAKLNL